MLTTENYIRNAESRWLEQLQFRCWQIFNNVHLPSHDETHHERVWKQAKDLLVQLAQNEIRLSEKDIEKLLIATYFHDTGMSVSTQKDHGRMSREIAREFLLDKDLSSGEKEEILEAIEHHDKKDYSPADNKPDLNLRALLNLSDDLDALGFVGAYRYTEIYLLRDTPVTDIPDVVLENLTRRFHYIKSFLSFSPAYLKTQRLRYMATRNFFKDLNFQMKQAGDDLSTCNGPIGIVNYLKEFIFRQNMHVRDAAKNILLISGDFYVTNFFEKLEKEFALS